MRIAKKLLALTLALALMVPLFSSCEAKPAGTLTVGVTSFNGDFIYGFGNSAYDAMVKDLVGGEYYYSIYRGNKVGEVVQNTVVTKEVKTEIDGAGNKTYTITLNNDLKWNDGTALTAKDYIFALLFKSSPQWREVGATYTDTDSLVGYTDYTEGTTDVFAGAKLISDTQFSLTIAEENLPYFYETLYAAISPVCMASWAPGATINSGDSGVKLEGIDFKAVADTISSGERYAPTVTCGPYKFVSFQDQIATLTVNTYFKGDLDGSKPKFANIVVMKVNQETDVDQVIAGELDLSPGVIQGKKIEAAKAAATAGTHSYKRNGYGYLAFHCDWGITADSNVRWGISCLIDRNEVITYVLQGYGGTVNAEYGLAQWMYQERTEELNAAIQPISFNIDKANDYFDMTDWKFEKDGKTPFDRTKAKADGSYLRYNSKGEKMVVNHIGTSENDVTDIIEIQYKANAPMAGLEFNVTKSDFDALLSAFYYPLELGEDRFFNTFNLATTFDVAFDPYYASNHSDFFETYANSNKLSDPELDSLIMDMRSVDSSQTEEFADKWVAYQTRWNQLLPTIPLYSNEYYDIYNTRITGLDTTPFANWARTICSISEAK